MAVRGLDLAVATVNRPCGLGPLVWFDARHLTGQVHAFESRPLRRGPLQMGEVVTAVGRESYAPLGRPSVADTADQAARVDSGDPDEMAILQPLVQRVTRPPIGGRSNVLAQYEAAARGRARLDILVVGPTFPMCGNVKVMIWPA